MEPKWIVNGLQEDIPPSILFTKNGKKYETTINGEKANVEVIIKEARVKYNVGKYNKIVIQVPQYAGKVLKSVFEVFENNCETKFDEYLNVKINEKQKEQLMQEVSQGDYIDIAIKLNGIWTVSEKNYASFELIAFQKVTNVEIRKKYF